MMASTTAFRDSNASDGDKNNGSNGREDAGNNGTNRSKDKWNYRAK